MPGMNGLVATRKLKERQPDTGVVTLTRHTDDAYLQELLRAGASGYVLKQSAPDGAAPGDSRGGRRRPIPRFRAHRARDRHVLATEKSDASRSPP